MSEDTLFGSMSDVQRSKILRIVHAHDAWLTGKGLEWPQDTNAFRRRADIQKVVKAIAKKVVPRHYSKPDRHRIASLLLMEVLVEREERAGLN
jgi:hypothetical protein